jgi:hypothetical protein
MDSMESRGYKKNRTINTISNSKASTIILERLNAKKKNT